MMRRRRTGEETGAARNCAPFMPAARRHRLPGFPASLPSLAVALFLAAGTLSFVGGSEDDVAEGESARTAPSARPPAGGQPLRRLLEDCSRTPVCDRLPRGWTRFLDPASGCDYYWNAFTQSSTWDAPVCIPQRPPVAPAVPGSAPPHPSLPTPVQTTAHRRTTSAKYVCRANFFWFQFFFGFFAENLSAEEGRESGRVRVRRPASRAARPGRR